jgi:hypothetical protein
MAEGAASDIAALLRREHRMSAPHSRDQLYDLDACERLAGKASQKYLKFSDQPIWLSLSVG